MINKSMLKIRQDKLLNEYLKYHSYWYEEIILDDTKIDLMIKEMKKELKINPEDKIENIKDKLELFSSIIEVLK